MALDSPVRERENDCFIWAGNLLSGTELERLEIAGNFPSEKKIECAQFFL
jgi:uncharacterized protein (UPF0179 family)